MKKRFDMQQNAFKQMEKSLKEQMSKEIKNLQDYIDREIGRVISQINDIEKRVEVVEQRMYEMHEFNYDDTVIALNVPTTADCSLDYTVGRLIREGLGIHNIQAVKTKRLESRNNKPGLVKIQLRNLEEKKKILLAKANLQHSETFSRVYLRSSKSHAERTAEMNFRTLLNSIPNGNKFRLTANGKLVAKDDPRRPLNPNPNAVKQSGMRVPPDETDRSPRPKNDGPPGLSLPPPMIRTPPREHRTPSPKEGAASTNIPIVHSPLPLPPINH